MQIFHLHLFIFKVYSIHSLWKKKFGAVHSILTNNCFFFRCCFFSLFHFFSFHIFFNPSFTSFYCVILCVFLYRYLVRPSPFSAQKTFERHNSRRKSNISYCSNLNIGQSVAAAAAAAASRRGSGFGMNLNTLQGVLPGYGSQRAPPIVTNKSNSLSLPDSPTLASQTRARSNSLRVNEKHFKL